MPLVLLLFLICTVLSAVVLSAGTASAGRYSQLVDADQRYYAVTSAAELIKDKLDEQKVTVDLSRSYDVIETVSSSGTSSNEGESTYEASIRIGEGATRELTSESGLSLLEQAVSKLMLAGPHTDDDKKWAFEWDDRLNGGGTVQEPSLPSLVVEPASDSLPGGIEANDLKVIVRQAIDPNDSSMAFTFMSEKSGDNGYEVTMRLAGDVDVTTGVSETLEDPVITSDGKTVTTKVKEEKTIVFTWQFSEFEKIEEVNA